MRISDLFMMSVRSLWRRKLRTFLTVLGVVIGTTSIVLMLSLGIAMNENFKKQLEDTASLTLISVSPNNFQDAKAPKLDDKALETIKRMPGVQMVIPDRSTNVTLVYGKYRVDYAQIKGLSREEMDVLGYKVAQGELFLEGDQSSILLGRDVIRQFVKRGQVFDWRTEPKPMEFDIGTDTLKIDMARYDMDGNLAEDSKGNKVKPPKPYKVTVKGLFGDEDYQNAYLAIVSPELYQKIVEDKTKYEKKFGETGNNNDYMNGNKYMNVMVKATSNDEVLDVVKAINEAGYYAYSNMDWIEQSKKSANSIQMMLGGIGAISLFVAAIGITNTMMMSIYERTKEIGVMKVIGAKLTDIKQMFLLEALLIGAIGGASGVLFSYGLSFLVNKYGAQIAGQLFSMMLGSGGETISLIPPWLALLALGFSTFIGLVSGYFPARRAMSLSALSAIRTE